jgi:membrane protein DedA with SNARE-associated domain/rhodanese-related sulfurtransferase
MSHLTELLVTYGVAAVFVSVLIDEGGAPLPSFPVLLLAGAAVSSNKLSLAAILLAAIGASVIADTAWFYAGRLYGRRVLSILCRISLSPDSCVRQVETTFNRVGPLSLLFVRFIPGLTNITIAMAGITRVSWLVFSTLNLIGATVCAAGLIFIGMIFHRAIDDIIATLSALGEIGGLIVLAAIIFYLTIKFWERAAFTRQLKMDRVSVEELVALMQKVPPPVILDVRTPEARAREGMIPGSLSAHPTDMDTSLSSLNKESEIVIYCACPNEASAAVAATHLKRAGFRKIRPLRGGVDAWLKAGHELATIAHLDR